MSRTSWRDHRPQACRRCHDAARSAAVWRPLAVSLSRSVPRFRPIAHARRAPAIAVCATCASATRRRRGRRHLLRRSQPGAVVGAARRQRRRQDHDHRHDHGPRRCRPPATCACSARDMARERHRVLHRMNFESPYVDMPMRLTVRQNLTVFGSSTACATSTERIAELAGELQLDGFPRPAGRPALGRPEDARRARQGAGQRAGTAAPRRADRLARPRHGRLGPVPARTLPRATAAPRSCSPPTTCARWSACATGSSC